MPGRLRHIAGHEDTALSAEWELSCCDSGAIASPASLNSAALTWTPTSVPSTAAASLRQSGAWSLDGAVRRFDAHDWWYRTRFAVPPAEHGEELWLCFDGLATVADVWLNGELLLTSTTMFVARECRIDGQVRSENELVIRFRALDALLRVRRARARWRAPMVENQQLRWFRTTLLGRTPGWSPPAAPVGPWRRIRVERRRGVAIGDVRLRATADGRLDVSCLASSLDDTPVGGGQLVLERNGRVFSADLTSDAGGARLTAHLLVEHAEQWWPHTHGAPALYAARIRLGHGGGVVDADIGAVGFRSIELTTRDDEFSLAVNDVPLFCRGACWTPLDPVGLSSEPQSLDRAFGQVISAGMNMLRVSGPMVYESDEFLDRCDARGVLLWQEFMFANLDYPGDDPEFAHLVNDEARQLVARLQGRPSLAVLCGNSEVEQQAAMWAAPRESWQPSLFHELLASIVREALPDVPYWPSSAHGGAFPHDARSGSSSYYGVGAYLRPLDDARRAEVRFATECLAFANVPEPRSLALLPGGLAVKADHAGWKSRSPRDTGASWDFDDVRDHYIASLFRVDPPAVRRADHDRYLALGRVATGEVMSAVISEWRRQRSLTRGALVWFLTDLWPGAGWGVVDSTGSPKAAWHYLRRAMAPVAISLSDEGCNGIGVHVSNDRPHALAGSIEIALHRADDVLVGRASRPIHVAPHSALELDAGSFFDGFQDLSYAYRFGPPSHRVMVASLLGADGALLSQAFHFIGGLPNEREPDVGLRGALQERSDGAYELIVGSLRFAQSVCVDVEGFAASDNYFHVAAGTERHLILHREPARPHDQPHTVPTGELRALNSTTSAALAVGSPRP